MIGNGFYVFIIEMHLRDIIVGAKGSNYHFLHSIELHRGCP